jgi:hypothetical protein
MFCVSRQIAGIWQAGKALQPDGLAMLRRTITVASCGYVICLCHVGAATH